MQPTLGHLEALIPRELDMLSFPSAEWVAPRTAPDGSSALDCAIIGAGQYGLVVGHGLWRERVRNIALFDAAPPGQEGPWVTFARMAALRTPKHLTGPDLGLPSLSFRAWYEAQHGAEGWAALDRIPRATWMDYLIWYRRVVGLPIHNGWGLEAMEPAPDDLIGLSFRTPEGVRNVFARTVVLATGGTGGGGFSIPAAIKQALPAERLRHENEVFDVAAYADQRIAVLGAGAAGFDVAVAALKAGAVSADLCFRRPTLPNTNPRRWMENAGFLGHFVDLPDAAKWAYVAELERIGQPPPTPTFEGALAQPGFALHGGMPWDDIRWSGAEIVVEAGGKRLAFDHAVVATGPWVNLAARPETRLLAEHAVLWGQRYAPPAEQASAGLAQYPYLDRWGGFTARDAQGAWVERVFTIARGASLSLGPIATSNSGMKYVAPRLVEGVRRRLFLDQQEATWRAFITGDFATLPAGVATAPPQQKAAE